MRTQNQRRFIPRPRLLRMVFWGLVIAMLGVGFGANPLWAKSDSFPTPEGLTLTVQSDRIAVEWYFTVEPGIATYTLERSETGEQSDAVAVPAFALSSTGDGNPVLVYYSMIDATVEPGHSYTYWLTVTDAAGDQATFGPLTAEVVDDASEPRHQLFLPVVIGG